MTVASSLDYKQCAKDWRYSKSIRYNNLSSLENLCINGVRNNTLKSSGSVVSDYLIQKTHNARKLCIGYFDKLEKKFGLSKNELTVFGQYIASRQFPVFGMRRPTTIVQGKKLSNVEIIKSILDLLAKEQWIDNNTVVTPDMLKQFMQDYRQNTP